jgi:alpha-L-arabinofuranosidase
MVAALSADHKFLTLAVVNATDSEQKFDLAVDGVRLSDNAKLWRMTASDVEAANKVGQPPEVEVKASAIGGAPTVLSVPRISVDIYRFSVAQTAP